MQHTAHRRSNFRLSSPIDRGSGTVSTTRRATENKHFACSRGQTKSFAPQCRTWRSPQTHNTAQIPKTAKCTLEPASFQRSPFTTTGLLAAEKAVRLPTGRPCGLPLWPDFHCALLTSVRLGLFLRDCHLLVP